MPSNEENERPDKEGREVERWHRDTVALEGVSQRRKSFVAGGVLEKVFMEDGVGVVTEKVSFP